MVHIDDSNMDSSAVSIDGGSLAAGADSCGCGSGAGSCGCGDEAAEGSGCGCGGGSCSCGAEAEETEEAGKAAAAKIEEVNSKRPEVKMDTGADPRLDPILAPYHRTLEELQTMPVLEETMSVCPECKLIIKATIYKDDTNVMIRKFCPEHKWTVEKYWEDYDMYMKMRRYNYFGRGLDNPNYLGQGQNCPFDCGICERHKSHTGLANVVVTNRCHLSCWYCFFYAKEGEPIYEPTVDELDKIFRNLKAAKPIPCNALQITGGEPTMHPEIIEVVKRAKKAGFGQIQLNTTGIKIGAEPEFAKQLQQAGVKTLYMSYDGVSARTNPKNYWEAPQALDSCRKADIGIVLVPTVIRGINDHEMGALINFALNNMDVVRAVNFQPVSLVGRMPTRLREKQRITIPGAIKEIEEQTNGLIRKEHWFSVPYIGGINKFIEALSGQHKYDMSIHFACGAATYLFFDENKRVIPITEFIDAQGLVEMMQRAVNEMQGKGRLARKAIAFKALSGFSKLVDKQKMPKELNVSRMIVDVLLHGDFQSMAKFHHKSLFIGMMHFQDEHIYDIHRVEKCDIHYAMPDGQVLPFCTFNVFPEVYRDKIQKQYSIPAKEWQKMRPDWNYRADKYIRDVKALEQDPRFLRTYRDMVDYFALPQNCGKPVANFPVFKTKYPQAGQVPDIAAGQSVKVGA